MNLLKCYNPTTGDLIKEIPITPHEEIKRIVDQSCEAQKKWAAIGFNRRAQLIGEAYKELSSCYREMAELIHEEMGKTIEEALSEVSYYSSNLDFMIKEVGKAIHPQEKQKDNWLTTTYYDPLGVCASITPWNFPMGMPHTLMIPSLLVGNSVVFKPSEEVTLIGLMYAEILNKVLPKNVLQVVVGKSEQGQQLVESNVQLITFTGSQATGKNILEKGAKDLKRVVLELGGKDPLILLEDGDIFAAAKFAGTNSFKNAGQVCVSIEKIYIPKKHKEIFLKEIKKHASSVEIGSMIHSRQKAHVIKQVKEALNAGAQLEYGELPKEEGNRVNPLILSNLKPDMDIMINETFGPVACIVTYNDLDEVIKEVNNTHYALGAVVFGQDTKKANEVARALKAGMVGINRSCAGVKGSPWIGALHSGYGYHGSSGGHRQLSQVRIVTHSI